MEPKDHLFEKENHLQNLHVWLQNVTVTVIFQAVCDLFVTFRCELRDPVVVLGGGVMGLSTAWSLSRSGVKVAIGCLGV